MSVQELDYAPTDIITAVRFSPDSSLLVVSGWDSNIAVFFRPGPDSTAPFTYAYCIEAQAPVLDVCFGPCGGGTFTLFTVGLDYYVTQYTLTTQSPDIAPTQETERNTHYSRHAKPSNKVAYSKEHDFVISISWDETMHVHDVESGNFIAVKLAAKPFAIALTADKAVISMVERKVDVYALADLKKLLEESGSTEAGEQPLEVKPWQNRVSSLKFMTRALSCMPDGTGFAASSIEGRVGVEWFDEEANKKTYAFKCHREKTTTKDEEGNDVPLDIIWPINGLAFHPVHGTFATGGGDGVVALWDANTKRRVRQYTQLCSSIACLEFSPDGRKLAIGVSPGFEDDKVKDMPDPALVKVFIREIADGEAKGKPAKEK